MSTGPRSSARSTPPRARTGSPEAPAGTHRRAPRRRRRPPPTPTHPEQCGGPADRGEPGRQPRRRWQPRVSDVGGQPDPWGRRGGELHRLPTREAGQAGRSAMVRGGQALGGEGAEDGAGAARLGEHRGADAVHDRVPALVARERAGSRARTRGMPWRPPAGRPPAPTASRPTEGRHACRTVAVVKTPRVDRLQRRVAPPGAGRAPRCRRPTPEWVAPLPNRPRAVASTAPYAAPRPYRRRQPGCPAPSERRRIEQGRPRHREPSGGSGSADQRGRMGDPGHHRLVQPAGAESVLSPSPHRASRTGGRRAPALQAHSGGPHG